MVQKRQFQHSSQVVQLELWTVIESAEEVPEQADLEQIWSILDVAPDCLSVRSQLKLAGDVIDRMAQIIHDRALLTIEEIHHIGNAEGPIMPPGAFDRFVRQSMQVNLMQFVEAPSVPPRAMPVGSRFDYPNDGRSVVAEIDQAALLEALDEELQFFEEPETYEQALALAHSENVQDWVNAIEQCFAVQPSNCIPLTELVTLMGEVSQEEVSEPQRLWVKTWLALLLGEYRLEQRGEFYQIETVWVAA
ncbi:unknown protein (plasmid) [Leptolyngbya sp. NIES-3755]|nr:unknown protein [Leptolyngbya sp. NIES-3755]